MAQQFDTLAEAYEAFARSPFRRHLEAYSVFSVLGDVRGMRVLDFGCGAGTYARWIRERGADTVVGLDVSEGMIAHAREQEARHPLGITYHLDALPSSLDGTFDIVLAVYVLPYATTHDELTTMCRMASRALRPAGRFVTLPLNPDFHAARDYYEPYGFRLHGAHPRHDGDPVILELGYAGGWTTITARYWSKAALTDALTRADFEAMVWSGPRVSPEGISEQEPGFWDNYVTCPHAVVVDARRKERVS